MKYFLVFFLVLLVSCKKKNLVFEIIKINYIMMYLGLIDGVVFSYLGSLFDIVFFKINKGYDYWFIWYYDLLVWIDGKYFDENVVVGE